MRIDGKIAEGWVLLCGCGEAHVLERIGISVECPACGRTAMGADVAAEYHLRSLPPAPPEPRPEEQPIQAEARVTA